MPQRQTPTQKTFKALPGFETALVNLTKTDYQYKYNDFRVKDFEKVLLRKNQAKL